MAIRVSTLPTTLSLYIGLNDGRLEHTNPVNAMLRPRLVFPVGDAVASTRPAIRRKVAGSPSLPGAGHNTDEITVDCPGNRGRNYRRQPGCPPAILSRTMELRRLNCPVCTKAISVYEPVVAITGQQLRETSIAREPSLRQNNEAILHRGCAQGTGAASASFHAV